MWTQSRTTDIGSVTRFMGELTKQRGHYGRKTMHDLKDYLGKKKDIEAWVYDGEGYSVGVMLLEQPRIMKGRKGYCVSHAWFDGDITWDSALDLIIEKVKEYCGRHKVKTFCHRQMKDIEGKVSELLVTKPFDDDKVIVKLKEQFTDVVIEENEKNYLITITL